MLGVLLLEESILGVFRVSQFFVRVAGLIERRSSRCSSVEVVEVLEVRLRSVRAGER